MFIIILLILIFLYHSVKSGGGVLKIEGKLFYIFNMYVLEGEVRNVKEFVKDSVHVGILKDYDPDKLGDRFYASVLSKFEQYTRDSLKILTKRFIHDNEKYKSLFARLISAAEIDNKYVETHRDVSYMMKQIFKEDVAPIYVYENKECTRSKDTYKCFNSVISSNALFENVFITPPEINMETFIFHNGELKFAYENTENISQEKFNLLALLDKKEKFFVYVESGMIDFLRDYIDDRFTAIPFMEADLLMFQGITYIATSPNILIFGEMHVDLSVFNESDKYTFVNYLQKLDAKNLKINLYTETAERETDHLLNGGSYNFYNILKHRGYFKNINVFYSDIRGGQRIPTNTFECFTVQNLFFPDYESINVKSELYHYFKSEYKFNENETKYETYLANNPKRFITRTAFEFTRVKNNELKEKVKQYLTRIDVNKIDRTEFAALYTDLYVLARLERKKNDYNILIAGALHSRHYCSLISFCKNIKFKVYNYDEHDTLIDHEFTEAPTSELFFEKTKSCVFF